MFDILRRVFGNFKVPIDYELYCNIVQKFIALDEYTIKEIMFGILDFNKDKKVCETDLFNSIKLIDNPKMYKLMAEDI